MTTTAELKERFTAQADAAGLQIECAMGGTVNATLAIIAEAPGRNEIAQGIPLVGGSGNILWKAIRTHCPEVKRHECYITNVVKRQVAFDPGEGSHRKPVTKHELSSWQELLLWELEHLPNLQHVLLLGNFAIEAILKRKGITAWRGSVIQCIIGNRQITAVATYNPAFCVYEPLAHIVFDMDIADKLRPVVLGRYKPHVVTTHINPTHAQALDYIAMCKASRDPVASDIEVISNAYRLLLQHECIARNEETNTYPQHRSKKGMAT